MDRNVVNKEKEKIDKYLNLLIELQHLWDTKIKIVPIVFSALGSISDALYTYLSLLQVTDVIECSPTTKSANTVF